MPLDPGMVGLGARGTAGYDSRPPHAPVAQLDRVLPSEGVKAGFESALLLYRDQALAKRALKPGFSGVTTE